MKKVLFETENESKAKRLKKGLLENDIEIITIDDIEKKIDVEENGTNKIENKIYLEVKKRCEQPTNAYGIGAWDHHIKIVYELAKQHSKDYDADTEIVALAALLHDIASVTNASYTEEHHIIGAQIAEEICIADVDAMAHFYSIPSLLSMVYRKKKRRG